MGLLDFDPNYLNCSQLLDSLKYPFIDMKCSIVLLFITWIILKHMNTLSFWKTLHIPNK